jgi:hypothetical protein
MNNHRCMHPQKALVKYLKGNVGSGIFYEVNYFANFPLITERVSSCFYNVLGFDEASGRQQ